MIMEQQVELVGSYEVKAHYNEKKNETKIYESVDGSEKEEVIGGLKILGMQTIQGGLSFTY